MPKSSPNAKIRKAHMLAQALVWAVKENQPQEVASAMQAGALAKTPWPDGEEPWKGCQGHHALTVFEVAMLRGNPDVIAAFLDNGVPLSQLVNGVLTDDPASLLGCAIRELNEDLAVMLVKRGASLSMGKVQEKNRQNLWDALIDGCLRSLSPTHQGPFLIGDRAHTVAHLADLIHGLGVRPDHLKKPYQDHAINDMVQNLLLIAFAPSPEKPWDPRVMADVMEVFLNPVYGLDWSPKPNTLGPLVTLETLVPDLAQRREARALQGDLETTTPNMERPGMRLRI